jgi:hypothetical protein
MMLVDVPFDIYAYLGIDLIRDHDGDSMYWKITCALLPAFPICENRSITYRIFPDLLPRNNAEV